MLPRFIDSNADYNSGQQRLNYIDQTHLELASGKLVLQKRQAAKKIGILNGFCLKKHSRQSVRNFFCLRFKRKCGTKPVPAGAKHFFLWLLYIRQSNE